MITDIAEVLIGQHGVNKFGVGSDALDPQTVDPRLKAFRYYECQNKKLQDANRRLAVRNCELWQTARPKEAPIKNNLQTITDGLSEAQRHVLLAANRSPRWHTAPKAGCWRRQGAVMENMGRKHRLFEIRYEPPNRPRWFQWTPLGLAFRTCLLDEEAKQ